MRSRDHYLEQLKFTVVLAGCTLAFGCTSKEPSVVVRQSLCDLQAAPEGCAQTCSAANPFCGNGYFCGNNGHCDAQCTPDNLGFCDLDQTCSSSGKCVKPTEDAASCVSAKSVATQPTNVNLLIVVDRSGSMGGFASGIGKTRWEIVQDFLLGPSGFLQRRQSQMRMSLSTFYALNSTCPNMPPITAPVLNNANAMAATLQPPVPGGQTPTAQAIQDAASALGSFDLNGPKIILLITDGEPTSCSGNAPTDETRQVTIDAARQAYSAGIYTYVVGVGSEVSDGFLATLAGAGQGTNTAAILRADDINSLTSAINSVLYPNLSCTIELQGAKVTPGTECAGQVLINGEASPLPCNSDIGWKLLDESHIELSEDACYRYKTSASLQIQASFPCSSLVETL